MKILVTGGAGFIGSHIVDAYLAQGHKVSVLDNLSKGRKSNLNPKISAFYQQDIGSDLDLVFKKEKFDLANHHAAQPSVPLSVKDPIFDAKVNILGQINLLQACAAHKVKKIIFSSSGGAIYGTGVKMPAKETDPLNPISPYGISKMCAEKYIQYFASEYGLKYTILRYANVYGPRDHFDSGHVITVFTHLLLKGKKPTIDWDGNQSKDYVYVDDVTDINCRALEKGKNEIYNVGSGIATSVNEIYKIFMDVLRLNLTPERAPKRAGDLRLFYLNAKKAKRDLGWQPKVDLRTGIQKTVEWFQKNR